MPVTPHLREPLFSTMPRPNYFQPAGVALHIIQRARAACFPGERDRLAYLHWLRGYADAQTHTC